MTINKKRLDSIESKLKHKIRPYVSPKTVFKSEGVFTSKDQEVLTKDNHGNFLHEDGSIYYKNEDFEDGQIGLIVVELVK